MTMTGTLHHSLLALAIAVDLLARGQAASGLDVWKKLKANGETLKQYSYKRRTEVTLKGELRGARVDLVRYVNGRKETIPLEAPVRNSASRDARGIRGKIVERKVKEKREELKAEVEKLQELMSSYLSPDSEAMVALLRDGSVSRAGSGADADLVFTAAGFKRPSDTFKVVWNVAKHQPLRIEIRVQADGRPVQLNIDYSTLPDGTFYPARTVIHAPKKELVLTVTTFDYSR